MTKRSWPPPSVIGSLSLCIVLLQTSGVFAPVIVGYRTACEVKLWDVERRKQRATIFHQPLRDGRGPYGLAVFSPDSRFFALRAFVVRWDVSAIENWRVWEVNSAKEVRSLSEEDRSWILSIEKTDFFPGKVFAVSELANRKFAVSPEPNHKDVSADGSTIAGGYNDSNWAQQVWVWDAAPLKERARFWHLGTIREVKCSPNGKLVASSAFQPRKSPRTGIDITVQVWDTHTHKELLSRTGFDPLVFSPDGTLFAMRAGEKGDTIQFWDTQTWGRRTILQVEAGTPEWSWWRECLVFSPDSTLLASCGPPGSRIIKLWDVASGKELAALTGHRYGVRRLQFSPDGRTLASEAEYGQTIVDYGEGPVVLETGETYGGLRDWLAAGFVVVLTGLLVILTIRSWWKVIGASRPGTR